MTVEIKLRRKYTSAVSSTQKSRGSNSGATKTRQESPKGAKEAAQRATKENQRVLLLVDGRKRRFVRAKDLA